MSCLHRLGRLGVRTTHRAGLDRLEVDTIAGSATVGHRHGADRLHVRRDLDAECAQERLRDAARRHARRGLARARALEDVARVVRADLQHAREDPRARAAARSPGMPSGRSPATAMTSSQFSQSRLAIGKCDRAADGLAEPHAREDRSLCRSRCAGVRLGRTRPGGARGRGRCPRPRQAGFPPARH